MSDTRPALEGALLYTVADASTLTRIGKTRLFELLASGAIDSVLIGKSRRIPHDALVRYIDSLRSRAS